MSARCFNPDSCAPDRGLGRTPFPTQLAARGDGREPLLCGRAPRATVSGNAPLLLYTGAVMSCLFCKIIEGSIPSKAVYQDDQCYAFADINPQAPVHVLLAPRRHIASMAEGVEDDRALFGHLLWAAARIAAEKGLGNGYRVVINTGSDGGQTVDHLHVHLLGGRALGWPPG